MRLYAHRGAAAECPENTLAAFRLGLDRGADALETDAHLTADGVVVLSHDPDGARMAGVPRLIRECSLAEVQSWDAGRGFLDAQGERPWADRGLRIPTLEEALIELPGTWFNVDLKQREPDLVGRTVALIRRLKAQDRVLLTSFHGCVVRRVRALGYEGPTGLSREEVAAALVLPAAALAGLGWRGRAVQIPVRAGPLALDRERFIARCHRAGMRVDYWTINDPLQARRLLEGGADGVMSDDPGRIAPVVKELRRRRGQDLEEAHARE